MNIRKGDNVKIITGKDKSKSGKILKVFPQDNKILVEGLNLCKKHVKPRKQGEKGEIVSIPRPLNASNVMVICGNCKKITRVGCRLEGKGKIRICKKCLAKI